MTKSAFRKALGRHLLAIEKRDLQGLAGTVEPDELVLVTAEGRLVTKAADFLEMHRGWFATPGWTLDAKPVEIIEGADLGVAVLRLDYREPPSTRSESFLTLVFRRRGDRWLMALDQNTPIR